MKHRVSRHSDRWRPRTELRATENTARNVLKLLRRMEGGSWGSSIGGKTSDAVGLAGMIEQLGAALAGSDNGITRLLAALARSSGGAS